MATEIFIDKGTDRPPVRVQMDRNVSITPGEETKSVWYTKGEGRFIYKVTALFTVERMERLD